VACLVTAVHTGALRNGAPFKQLAGRGRHAIAAPDPERVTRFADWMDVALRERWIPDLLEYRHKAPFAGLNHPTEEHLLPMFVALGAGDGEVSHLHASSTHGILRMHVYSFAGG
jgi:4,5-DOPA dioxygenase extradiol